MGSTRGVYSRRVYLSDTLSTAESEWYAASEAGKELLYLRIIMREFGFPHLGPMHLYEDSRAVIAMAENPRRRNGARHIDTREHFVDQHVKDRIVKLVQCRTNKMVADALTKNLSAPVFEQHRATMLGEDEAPFSAMMCVACRGITVCPNVLVCVYTFVTL